MKREVIVVTGAYGTDTVQQRGGQAAMLPIIADAGADGVEIRRELFSPASWITCRSSRRRSHVSSCSRCIPLRNRFSPRASR
ncbi:Uncharacterised protein [Serratia rubidaea]|uniref:Xylose isomerase-like TIM barrel n=1 Tax=Serratia rubidaea TaxID=61652 RepID=A0A3S4FXD3_SERRU|nr:Uncharacterised protein [Serratia rubidaea]